MKKRKVYYVNIILTIIIILLSLYLNNIYPFGSNVLGDSDALLQIKPMLYDFIMKIKTKSLLNYSFNNGLGNPFTFNFLYYLASPLNLIALLFKHPNSMFLSIIILKNVITSITITYYLKKKTNNNYIIIIGSLSYVFCSWNIVYRFFNIWLDIFMIFPLFQYGLEQLLDKHKYHIYIFTLSYILITNFFLAFSVCMYTLLYFIIYELLYKKDSKKNKLLTFDYIALSTIISCLLSFLFLYILYDCIIKMKIPVSESINTNYQTGLIEFLKSLYYGTTSFSPLDYGKVFPNYTCSTIVLVGSVSSLFNQNISKKNKIYIISTLLLIITIIYNPKLDSIMNGFHNVRGYPYRYSFIISFLMVKLFVYNMNNIKIKKLPICIIIIILLIIGIILSIKNIQDNSYYSSIIFLIISFILVIFNYNNRINNITVVLIVILQILIVDYNYIETASVNENLEQFNYNTKNVKYRLNTPKEQEDSIYEGINYYTNTKTTYFFSSMSYNRLIKTVNYLGGETYFTTVMIIHDNNELLSMLLNVKNRKNNYYLEKIYSVNKNILKTEMNPYDTKYNLEQLIIDMTDIEDIFEKKELKAIIKNNEYQFNTNYDYYLIELSDDKGATNIIPQDYKQFSQKIKYGKETATIYVLNNKKLKNIYDFLSKNQIKYTYYNDNHIKGTINVDKDQIVFTSIPYDKDWIVKVDGKIVKQIELLDSLMGIDVTPGKHEIELEYKTHYLIPTLISITTFILLIIDIIRKKKI